MLSISRKHIVCLILVRTDRSAPSEALQTAGLTGGAQLPGDASSSASPPRGGLTLAEAARHSLASKQRALAASSCAWQLRSAS